jgi:hypothetical protein
MLRRPQNELGKEQEEEESPRCVNIEILRSFRLRFGGAEPKTQKRLELVRIVFQ